MKRYAFDKLVKWKDSYDRKPLIIRGARQVGKTWLMLEFGRRCFENYAYARLEFDERFKRLFEASIHPKDIIQGLNAITGEPIIPGKTLIILDEIQAVPRALSALKYFKEEASEYHIVVAGSLLGLTLNEGNPYPVGKVNYLDLYPLSFREFLLAQDKEQLVNFIDEKNYTMLEVFRDDYIQFLRQYFYVGGMPGVVNHLLHDGSDLAAVRSAQLEIIQDYIGDFGQHCDAHTAERCREIFESIPAQLAREHKKFIYGIVKEGARGRDYEDALRFLVSAGLLYRINRAGEISLPLKGFEDRKAFKSYLLDVGLLSAMARVNASYLIEGNTLFNQYKGALTEQFVCQELMAECDIEPKYWTNPRNTIEIDFLADLGGEIVPIEVKAEENLRSKSLATFCKNYQLENAIRFSLANYRDEGWMRNIPLYMVSSIKPEV